MTMETPEITIDELQAKVGSIIGSSQWFSLDQQLIDHFATLTQDEQFIHVDPERAAQTDFGGTIAHGFLVLSLLSAMYADAVPPVRDATVAINAGFDRVRFVSPVRSGSRVRATFTLASIERLTERNWRTALQLEIWSEHAAKPAVVAQWLLIWVV